MKEEKDRLAAGTTEIPAIIQANKIKGEIQINYFRLLIVTLTFISSLYYILIERPGKFSGSETADYVSIEES